ncbi:Uncharacterised protein [Zhongshania aliphaticivorans]|uniref:Uncharacterized protein n=1 Tax=Zhongshania aliphaticivorans TaxID=1470434 RepID=A0A5S9N2M7_9GAMM|nr:hypothetical protein [Zhongshania aliphaticivorans]CAA0082859.1 Uncharacterised protein [Zhongshania aliphaticivorans]CAA0083929.1 Uncharacterised protein [Zhongshania aliphaticivorans]
MIKIIKLIIFTFFVVYFASSCAMTTTPAPVRLSHGVDESSGGLPSYIVRIANATFYLEKTGGGLSSMVDKDGIDWIGFHKEPGSGWKGEYRGFPNAIHKQDGSYFHAMNAGTDPARSELTVEESDHVQIIFTSANGKWQGQWDFYADRCDFTMTAVSPGYKYWVQYEGVPGGEMDKDDFWYASADNKSHLIDEPFKGDLPAPEWYAFGDVKSPRMLYILHHEDDEYPDDYLSRPYMTVLGFGRSVKAKHLTSPQTFSIGFVESTEHQQVEHTLKGILDGLAAPTSGR